jgi:hypothetical protein
MSDRTPRPEWRAAYLNRTLPRRALRHSNRAVAATSASARDGLAVPRRAGAHTTDATAGSFPMSFTAMLHLVPTA